MYGSTWDALMHSTHGFPLAGSASSMITALSRPAKRAVTDYRVAHRISADMHPIDWTGVYWRKAGEAIG